MTRLPLLALVAAGAIPALAAADTPNIESGEWEFESETSFEGDMELPGDSQTSRECVRAEDIADSILQMDAEEGVDCSVTERSVSADSMTYTMSCTDPEGGSFEIDGELSFMGDTASGIFSATMNTPMGEVDMRQTMQARRIGDC